MRCALTPKTKGEGHEKSIRIRYSDDRIRSVGRGHLARLVTPMPKEGATVEVGIISQAADIMAAVITVVVITVVVITEAVITAAVITTAAEQSSLMMTILTWTSLCVDRL